MKKVMLVIFLIIVIIVGCSDLEKENNESIPNESDIGSTPDCSFKSDNEFIQKNRCFIEKAIQNENVTLCESDELNEAYQIICLGEFSKIGLISNLNLTLCERFESKNKCYLTIIQPKLGKCSTPDVYACDKNVSRLCRCLQQNCRGAYNWIVPRYCPNGCNESTGKCN